MDPTQCLLDAAGYKAQRGWLCATATCGAVTLERRGIRPPVCPACDGTSFRYPVAVAVPIRRRLGVRK